MHTHFSTSSSTTLAQATLTIAAALNWSLQFHPATSIPFSAEVRVIFTATSCCITKHPKTKHFVMENNDYFVVPLDSRGQDLGKSRAGKALLCSLVSRASAERRLEYMWTGIIWRLLHLYIWALAWDDLKAGFSWDCQPDSLPLCALFTWLGLPHNLVATGKSYFLHVNTVSKNECSN